MVTKPGLIGNGRKTISGDGALKNFEKNCALQKLSLDKGKRAVPCQGPAQPSSKGWFRAISVFGEAKRFKIDPSRAEPR
jgi:hypothetical protein